jgi:hypothetical protein
VSGGWKPQLDHGLDWVSMRTFVDTLMWCGASAALSWHHYPDPVAHEVSPYASPARATDLGGPPGPT